MLNLFDLKNKLGKRKLVIFVLVSIFLFVFSVSAKSVNAKTIDIGLINDYIHIPGRIGLGVTNPSYSLTLGGAGVGLQGTSTNILSLFTNSLERLTINANGNVGIGTTNPQFPLDVVGYIRSSQGYKFSGSTNGQFTISAGNTYFDYEGGFNFRSLPSYGSSLYLTNSGHVGIGITNPAARLTVNGNTVLGGATQITPLGGGGNLIVMTDNEGNLYSTSTSAVIPEAMPVGTSGQTIRHDGSAWVANSNIFNNGTNVGVGKTNPAQKLDVSGSIQSTGDFISSASSVYLKSNSGTNTVFRGVRANTAWSDSVNAQWFQVGASSDNIAFTALSGTSAARMAFITNAFHVVTSAGSAAPVGLFDISNGSTKLFNVLNNGNVGIGITNPSARLNVSGNTLLGGATQITALGGSGNAIVMTDNTGNLYATSTSAIIPEAMPVGTSGQTIRHDGSAWVANSNIFNNGTNVGLGTATPGARLEIVDSKTHVSGSLAGTDSILRIFNSWQSDTVGKGAAITFEDNYYFSGSPVRTTRAGIKGGTELAGNNAEGFLAFYTDSSGANSLTERMRINSAGNVGIGITNPSARLNVSGSTILAGATQITPLAGAGNAVVMTDNTGTLYANAGMSYNRTAVSNVAYTAQASDYIIAYTYLSANRVLTLPATLCTAGKAFVITNETDSAYSVVVTPDSGRLISGQASISLPAFNSIPVYCNGTNWFIY